MKNQLQKLGALLLVVTLILTWMTETGWAYFALAAVGIIDIDLWFNDKQTISQWVQGLWPKKIDYPILVGLSVYTFAMFFKQFGFVAGMQAALPLFVFFLLLHLFANKY